jgi:thiamine-monophosphate kinase
VALIGGDTVAAGQLSVCVTVLGEVDPALVLRRSGARPGDRLVLVGALGAAAAAVAAIEAGAPPDDRLLGAHRRPVALVAGGRALADAGAHAAIDVSDGLGADLGHLCAASGVRARVRAEALPLADGLAAVAAAAGIDPLLLACGGGEDFALLAAVPPERAAAAATAATAAEQVPSAIIGEVLPPGPGAVAVLDRGTGPEVSLDGLGYDHYRTGDLAWGSRGR